MKKFIRAAGVFVILVGAIVTYQNCGSKDSPPTSGGTLTVSPTSSSIGYGGTVQFTASGGTPPYNFMMYSGSGSVTSAGYFVASSVAGYSTIIVTDSQNATANASITVTSSGGSGAGTAYSTTVDNMTVCCPTGTSATSFNDTGTGQNHGIYVNNPSSGCCTAWEGPKNYGAPACKITCQ